MCVGGVDARKYLINTVYRNFVDLSVMLKKRMPSRSYNQLHGSTALRLQKRLEESTSPMSYVLLVGSVLSLVTINRKV